MKAVVFEQYGAPEVLHVKEVEKPKVELGTVLIKVGASGINPVDTYFRSGIRPVPAFPHIPHFDVAGTIVEVGDDVKHVSVGDRVWGTSIQGTSAEFVIADAEKVFPLADHLSFEDGAALAMAFTTAHLSLFYRGNLQEGESILIYGGAGAVGNAAIQLAKKAGAYVFTTASTKEKAQLAKEAGADEVIIFTEQDVVSIINNKTNGTGVQLILDMSLSENMDKNFEILSLGGRIVTVGSPKNNAPVLPWRLLNQKNASLLGILLFTIPLEPLKKAGKEISDLFAERKLQVHLAKVFSFEEAHTAHHALEQKKYSGTIVLVP